MKTTNRIKVIFVLTVLTAIILLPIAGCSSSVEHEQQSTVSVTGIGTVSVKPDMIQMSISLSQTAQTTSLAQQTTSKMVRQALEVLKNLGVEDKNITTTSLTFNPEYDYRPARRVLTGQRAEQTVTFSIHDIRTNGEKISQIIDRLVQINGIELNQMSFGVKNNTEYFVKSRELAFRKAEEKAQQYTRLARLKIAGVLSISEEGNQQFLPLNNRLMLQNTMAEQPAMVDIDTSTVLPSGEMEITTKITAVFILE